MLSIGRYLALGTESEILWVPNVGIYETANFHMDPPDNQNVSRFRPVLDIIRHLIFFTSQFF